MENCDDSTATAGNKNNYGDASVVTTMIKKRTQQDQQHPKQKKRKIVSEEEYISTLSTIIQRDYYCDIPALQNQIDQLNNNHHPTTINSIPKHITTNSTSHTNTTINSSSDNDIGSSISNANITSTTNNDGNALPYTENLTKFHSYITSKDNAEFEKQQKKEAKENQQHLQNLFSLSSSSTNQDNDNDDDTNFLASDDFNLPTEHQRIHPSKWKKLELHNNLFFVPSSLKPTNPPQNASNNHNQNHDIQTQQQQELLLLDNSNYNNDKNEDDHDHTCSNVADRDTALMPPPMSLSVKNKDDEKKIIPANTRFPRSQRERMNNNTLAVGRSPNKSNEFYFDDNTSVSTDLDFDQHIVNVGMQQQQIQIERIERMQQQKKEQNSFVDMTPIVLPNNNSYSQITAWDDAAGTPLILNNDSSSSNNDDDIDDKIIQQQRQYGNNNNNDDNDYESRLSSSSSSSIFELPNQNHRDKLAQLAQQKIEERKAKVITASTSSKSPAVHNKAPKKDKRKRKKKHEKTQIPTPTTTKITSSLTPAAMSLFSKKTQNNRNGGLNVFATSATKSFSSSKSRSTISASSLLVRSGNAFAAALRSSYSTAPQLRYSSSSGSRSSSRKGSSSRKINESVFKSTQQRINGINTTSSSSSSRSKKSKKEKGCNKNDTSRGVTATMPSTITTAKTENDRKPGQQPCHITDGLLKLS